MNVGKKILNNCGVMGWLSNFCDDVRVVVGCCVYVVFGNINLFS